MKIFITFFISILFLNSCNVSIENSITQEEKTNTIKLIDSLMNNWHKAAANADLEAYIGSMDSGAIYIGTDASENWTKEEFEEFCAPYFEKKTTWNFSTLKRNVFISQNAKTSWFDELLKTHMGTCRGSGTLELINGQWKIKHYVLSMTIPNDNVEAVKSAKQEKDDAFLKMYE